MPHVRAELLAVLRCPVTKASLVQQGDELVSSVPGPDGHPLRYRIADDILLLLRPEHLADDAAAESGQPGAPGPGATSPASPTTEAN